MAKNIVGDLKLKLGVENEKVLSELKGSLRGIASVAKVSGKDLLQIAEAVKNYSNKGRVSIKVIRGQVSALKGLQEQATVGGKAFRQLGKDVAKYEASLKSAEQAAQNLRVGTRRRGGFLKRDDPGGFVANVTELQQRIAKDPAPKFDETGALTKEYIEQQSKLALNLEARERMEARVEARIRSVTQAQSDNNPTLRTASGMLETFGGELAKLPPTANNLQLELKELKSDLGNLVIGGEDYVRVLGLIKQKEDQLAGGTGSLDARIDAARRRVGRADSSADRRAQKLAERASYYGGDSRSFRDETGAMIAPGAGPFASFRPTVLDQPREASGLFKTIASIGSAEARAATEMMGRSLSEVTAEIKKQAAASNGNVNSLNAQKAAFAQLRAGLDPTSQGFRDLSKEIDKVDRKLGRLGKKKFSLKGAAQSVGAIASAGIFGGAAGGAGALVGSLFGPGGAVVGGGIGTSAGIAAQQISGFTNYAASISLAEKALDRIISKEGEYAENARKNVIANQTIEYAVKKLNVEREDATVGMTRLAAAVLGAGGTIEQASLAFIGTTKAIKATKGSADDVRGGLTALVQMFSKGRISAEELSGQLGERFPAAVTAFAEANDISGAVLQKQLKDGKVGLDKLIKFLVFATKKYSKGALEMAASAEESGERQKRSFDEVRRALGEQLINVGERLQEGIADSLKALTPVIVSTATVVANVVGVIIDGLALVIRNFRTLIDVIAVVGGGAVIGMLIKQVIILNTVIGKKGLVFAVKLASRTITTNMIPALGKMIALIRGLTLAMARNPFILIAMGITAVGVAAFKSSRKFEDFVSDIKTGIVSLKEATKGVDAYQKRLNTLGKINAIIQQDTTGTAVRGLTAVSSARSRGSTSFNEPLSEAARQVRDLKATLGDDRSLQALGPVRTARDVTNAMRADTGRIRRIRLASQEAEGALGFDPQSVIDASLEDINRLLLEGLGGAEGKPDLTDDQLKAKKAALMEVVTIADVEKKLKADIKVIELDNLKVNEEKLAKAELQFRATQQKKQIEENLLKLQQNINAQVDQALLDTGKITQEEFNQRELARQRLQLELQLAPLLKNGKINAEEMAEIIEKILAGVEKGQTRAKGFIEGLKELVKEAKDLNKTLGEFGVEAVNKFADTFADFVATGKASFREFANSVLQDLARIFARVAFFQALEAVFPGLGKTAKVAGSAKGNVIAKNKIVPYAMGGIVNKPTLFPMANGAGLMGEAGPEAIMPLRRGANGKLGVEASGGAMGNITVNVDAAGSSVEGDASQANQLGKAIGIAVQQELVKQKRPGGLLAS